MGLPDPAGHEVNAPFKRSKASFAAGVVLSCLGFPLRRLVSGAYTPRFYQIPLKSTHEKNSHITQLLHIAYACAGDAGQHESGRCVLSCFFNIIMCRLNRQSQICAPSL